jgi:hypothetical protein
VDSATDVRYSGVVVGRALQLRDRDETGAFVGFAEPLPVGTALRVKIDDVELAARVTDVVESADAAQVGMRIRFVSEAAERPTAAASATPVVQSLPPVASAQPMPQPRSPEPPPPAPPQSTSPAASEPPPPSTSPEPPAASSEIAHQGSPPDSIAVSSESDPAGGAGRRRRRRK